MRYFVLLTIFLFLSGCDSTSSDNNFSISGTVTIEGLSDLEIVEAALYKTVDIDEDLDAYKNQYSSIGAILSQDDFFDHRNESAVKTTFANTSGDYKISDVKAGTYNLVISAPGYGWKYITNIELGENLGDLNLSLYPEVEITNGNSDIISFEADRIYIIKQNVDFYLPFVINKSSIFLIDDSKSITFHNTIRCSTSSGKIKFISLNSDQDSFWFGLHVKSENASFQNISIQNASIGLQMENLELGPSIKNTLFMNCNIAISTFNINTFTIEKSTFLKNHLASLNLNLSSPQIISSLFIGGEKGIDQINTCNTSARNCIFSGMETAFKDRNDFAISVSNPEIYYSLFDKNSDYDIHWDSGNQLVVNFCNLIGDDIKKVFILQSRTIDTLNFKNNWWGTDDFFRINDMIVDQSDLIGDPNQEYYPVVDKSGYLSQMVDIEETIN
jgi:hypothetical protein